MAKRGSGGVIWHPEKNNKKTSIGFGNVKRSSMNKSKKASFKSYRGQGK